MEGSGDGREGRGGSRRRGGRRGRRRREAGRPRQEGEEEEEAATRARWPGTLAASVLVCLFLCSIIFDLTTRSDLLRIWMGMRRPLRLSFAFEFRV